MSAKPPLVRNTLAVECLIGALSDYTAADAAVRRARDESDNPSWEYFARDLIEERERAAQAFADRLNEYIDDRIRALAAVEAERETTTDADR